MLRLKLRLEHPERVAVLHQRAARWHQRDGRLADAVRQATGRLTGRSPPPWSSTTWRWRSAELAERGAGHPLAAEFAAMPADRAWAEPAPYLVAAALALAAGRRDAATAALDAADGLLDRLPADREAAGRLATERRPPHRLPSRGRNGASRSGGRQCPADARPGPGGEAGPASRDREDRAVRPGHRGTVVRPSRGSGSPPRDEAGRRGHTRPGARGIRAGRTPGAGGSPARPAVPRRDAGRTRDPRDG